MHVRNSHYNVIDLGGNILRDAQTQQLLGAVGRKAKNQFVVLHIGAASAWHTHGRGNCPTRGSIFRQSMAASRGGGAKEAERFIGGLAKTPNEQVVSSHVHDAMKTDHGRDSRRVFFFLGNLLGDLSREVPLLVSDIGSGCQHR